ncbi:MAG: copper chaperone PCu(A)C [Burkholderiaceae bacterium]
MFKSLSLASLVRGFTAALLPVVVAAAHAQAPAPVKVFDPWARGTVAAQRASGAFMNLVADEPLRLVGVSTDVAETAEVHEMTLIDNVMRMRRIDGIALEAGKPLELRPGGYHLMLMGLHQPLSEGEQLNLTLHFEDANGGRRDLPVVVPVRALTAAMPGHGQMKGDMKGGMAGHGHK